MYFAFDEKHLSGKLYGGIKGVLSFSLDSIKSYNNLFFWTYCILIHSTTTTNSTASLQILKPKCLECVTQDLHE